MTIDLKKSLRILACTILIVLVVFFFLKFKPDCIFKKIFNIACPTCGMTRAFMMILSGDILSSFKYNILAFPSIILFISFIIIYFYDLILKKDTLKRILNFILAYYILLIILPLIISMIVNNLRGI